MVPCLNLVHGKTDGCQTDPENEQISGTRTPKMETEGSKWAPKNQQWRHLGDKRHLRKQKRPQRGPMERPNGAQDADWRRKASKHGSNRAPKRCQKGSKSETLKKLKIELPLQRELSSAHERAPQNWVAHRKDRNEARGAL